MVFSDVLGPPDHRGVNERETRYRQVRQELPEHRPDRVTGRPVEVTVRAEARGDLPGEVGGRQGKTRFAGSLYPSLCVHPPPVSLLSRPIVTKSSTPDRSKSEVGVG